jgi:hypothetical protein
MAATGRPDLKDKKKWLPGSKVSGQESRKMERRGEMRAERRGVGLD